MSQISENLFNAIDIILDQRLSQLSFDRTIICTVTAIDNANKNKYNVKANGVTHVAYGNSGYMIGDQVYVMTPQNDDATEKVIVGLLTAPRKTSVATSLEGSLVIYKRLALDTTLSTNITDFVTMPEKFIFSANMSATRAQKITIIFTYENDETEEFVFSTSDIFGDNPSNLNNSPQEKIFDINIKQPLARIDIHPVGFELNNINLIFGDDIEKYTGNQVVVKTVNSLSYSSEVNKELYFSYLIYNNSGLVQKINPIVGEWQKYRITSGSDEAIDAYWSKIGEISNGQDFYVLNTSVSRPYDKIRVKANNIKSQALTFSNETWLPEDTYEEAIILGTDYSLIVEMYETEDQNSIKNTFTTGITNYSLRAAIKDAYSSTEVVGNTGLAGNIEYSLIYANNISLNNSAILVSNSSQPAFGILKATCSYGGIYYEAYVSLGWRLNSNQATFIGPTIVTYNSQGIEPVFNHNNFAIYDQSNVLIQTTWSLNKEDIFYPTLQGNKLIPTNTYFDGLDKDFYITATADGEAVWKQPIIIRRDTITSTNIQLDDTLLQTTLLSLLSIISNQLNGLAIGRTADDKTGLFGVLNNEQVFAITNKTINILDKYLRLDLEEKEGSVMQLNSKAYATEESPAAGFQLDLKNNKLTTPFVTIGDKTNTTIAFADNIDKASDDFLVTIGYLREKGLLDEKGEEGTT